MKLPYAVNYLILEVAYVGSHGIHLFGTRAINEAQLASPASAIWGAGIMVAPIIGPSLGAYLTDDFSWRWCFWPRLESA